jgi:hypothetical protein
MSKNTKKNILMLAAIPALAAQLVSDAHAIEGRLLKPGSWTTRIGEAFSDVPQLENDDVNPTELRDMLLGFNAQVVAGQISATSLSAGKPTFRLSGKIFDSCKYGLNVISGHREEDDGSTTPWIQIQDPQGSARVCQQKMKSLGYRCDSSYTCSDISNFGAASIPLTDYDSGEVMVNVQGNFVPFDNPAVFKSSFERINLVEQKRKLEAQRLHAPEINQLQSVLMDCPTTADGITRQRRALDKLSRIEGVLDSGEWVEIKREIDKNELKVLSDLARTVPVDELPEVTRRLGAVERIDNNLAASVYVQIAENYARSTEKRALGQAVATLKQGRTMGGLTDHNRVQLDNLYFDYKIKELREYAGRGTLSPGLYYREYTKLAADLQKRSIEVCGRGIRANGDACSAVTAQIQDLATQVPQDAQQGWQNRMQLQYYRGPSSILNSSSITTPGMFGRVLWW